MVSLKSVLIIDDDADMCQILSRLLKGKGYTVETAFSSKSGLEKFALNKYDVVVCDYRLPDSDGLSVIKAIKQINLVTQIIIVTGYSDVKLAIQCIREGAFEYVTKPIQREEILNVILEASSYSATLQDEENSSAENEIPLVKKELGHKVQSKYIFGSSNFAKSLEENINIIAPTDMSVIILGDSGTGKEVVARLIHERSIRKSKQFIAIDCGAIPHELASSELFGHVKGSFTGALNEKKGSFEIANGGTLFLDEIGNLSYENQIKLLRVIQERKIRKVGGSNDIEIDVRIVVATNENLSNATIRNGKFRDDLYYRLNEFSIHLLPLRERQNDLMLFADFFLTKANISLSKEVCSFSDEVIDRLLQYNWPGNLRELRNVIKRATLLTKGDQIELSSLPQEIAHYSDILNEATSSLVETPHLKAISENAEKIAIVEALKASNFNKTKTAKLLKVDRKTLYNKLVQYNIST